MKLKSFGCSFIFGTDLHDDGRLEPKATPSNYTWPALLARHHSWAYTCYARPGSGNLRILESVLNQLTDVQPAVYVVGWSYIDRFDYTVDPQMWRTVLPVDRDATAETYYKQLHSEYRDKLTTLIYVKTAIDALRASGNKFIMTYMDELMFDTRWNSSPAVSELQRYCEPYMSRFEGKTLVGFAKDHDYPISATNHPLELAHNAAFQIIDSYNLV